MSDMIKILAIDDNQDNLISIKALIREAFPQALTLSALNGTKGLELAAAEDPDVILLDIVMPGMDGFEVCKKLKADKKLGDIPVVFVTAIKGDKENRILALECGAEAFLAKPIDESELTAQIRAMVKIKTAVIEKRDENKRLTALVEEQTRELKKAHSATLKLLEDLRNENEARKESDNELLNSERDFRKLFEDHSAVKLIIDADTGNIVNANFSAAVYYGWSREELTRMNIQQINTLPPEDVMKELEKGKNHKQIHFEFKHRHADGTVSDVEVFASKIKIKGRECLHSIIHDITDRKQAEEVINRMAQMLDVAPNSITIHDINGNFIYANQKTFEMHGYTREEFLALPLGKLDTPKTAKLIPARMREIMEKGEANFKVEHIRKDGSILPLEIFVCKTKWGDTDSLLSIATDITERMRINKALKDSELKYRSLIESSSDAIFCVDENGEYKFTNHLFASTFGKTPEYFNGKTFWDVYDKEHADMRYEATKRVFRTGVSESLEVEVPLPDKTLYFLAKTNPIKDESGKIILNLTHASDITGLKLAEAKIREKDIEFRKLSANLSDMIFQFTRRPDGTYCVPIASEGIKNIFGCLPEEVLEDFTPIARVIHPDDAARVFSDIEYSAKHLTHFTCEFRVQLPGKAIQWIYSKSTPEKMADESVTWYGFNANITDRKLIENELIIAKEHAEESDRLKSAFLANMSHEIRTPMNGILGFADLLKEPELTGEQQQEYIRIIEKSGARMLNIINDIVDISKIEAGLMKLKLEDSNINEQIEYIYTFFKPEVEAKGLKFSLKTTLPAKEAIITTDREKVFAILTNLVKNAIKYTNKGSIEFGYNVVETLHATSLYATSIQFYVKDTGIGIPNDRQDAIFERFIQADIEDKNALQGAGLGLAISKTYVEMLGGKIWVESNIGKGSLFYFTLPCNMEITEDIITRNILSVNKSVNLQKEIKILIVEDNDISMNYIEIVSNMFSKVILKATTGVEAVETFRNNQDIDLILMDMKMPVMDGYEATRQIRQYNKEVIIIAQTAFAMVGDKEKALAAGCNDYISKPIIKEKLAALVQLHIKH
jgi:PAS domain S-box-containing protein